MKKMILLCAAAIMAFGASAQMSLVKDLAKKASSNDPQVLIEVLANIEPALTNPESANDVLTWFTAGKASIDLYNQLMAMKSINPEITDEMLQETLFGGFEYLEKALPLDSVPELNKDGSLKLNKDGSKKIKTKYSKNILEMMKNNAFDFLRLGDQFRSAEKYGLAADAYGKYVNFVNSSNAKNIGAAVPDSTLSEIIFLQGFSQFFDKNYKDSYTNLLKAEKLGYTENNISMYCNAALEQLILTNLNSGKYSEANSMIDAALLDQPNAAWLYLFKAISKEGESESIVEAFPLYKKAAEMDPNHADSQFYYGRAIAAKADAIINAKENENATTDQLMPKIKPIYEEALIYLNKAVELNADMNEAKSMIDKIKYLLYGE